MTAAVTELTTAPTPPPSRGKTGRVRRSPYVIGAVAIWVFFWGVAGQFGTVGGTSTVLDGAATLARFLQDLGNEGLDAGEMGHPGVR